LGLIGIWPEMKRKGGAWIAWLYGPMAGDEF